MFARSQLLLAAAATPLLLSYLPHAHQRKTQLFAVHAEAPPPSLDVARIDPAECQLKLVQVVFRCGKLNATPGCSSA
jgi:hypothetical protein